MFFSLSFESGIGQENVLHAKDVPGKVVWQQRIRNISQRTCITFGLFFFYLYWVFFTTTKADQAQPGLFLLKSAPLLR